jgi:hypothetical protein
MFHHEPALRHDAIIVPVAADDRLFNAPTATAWRNEWRLKANLRPSIYECLHSNLQAHHYSRPLPNELLCKHSRFTAYVVLNGILASVCEKQQMGLLEPSSPNFQKSFDALMCWYYTYELDHLHPQVDSFGLIVLWHTAFMNLLANFNMLERAIGRDGWDTPTIDSDIGYATRWAAAPEAERCVMHAYALQMALGRLRLDTEPAIHIPHCLFLAGIASFAYTKFRRNLNQQDGSSGYVDTATVQSVGQTHNYAEFQLPGVSVTSEQFDSSSHEHERQSRQRSSLPVPLGASMLCALTDILQRIGHWPVARRFAVTLGALCQQDTDEGWMLLP